jgi:hypothetical protein
MGRVGGQARDGAWAEAWDRTGRALLRPLVTLVVAAAIGLAVWQLLMHDAFVPERSPAAATEHLQQDDQRALERRLARPNR